MIQLLKKYLSRIGIMFLIIVGFLGYTQASCLSGSSNCDGNIGISLGIINSYQGSSAFVESFFSTGGVLYTSELIHDIESSASITSNYTLDGDIINPVPGSGNGSYTNTTTITLQGPDGIKTITTDFVSEMSERLSANDLEIFLDTTPPSTPTLYGPATGSQVNTNGVLFTRSPSTDGGSGLKEYELVISTSPTMIDPYVFTTEQDSLLINANLLPAGTLYWYVKATDNVGNESIMIPSYFLFPKNNNSSNNSGNGGNGGNNNDNDDDNEEGIIIGDTLYESPDPEEDDGLTYVFTFDDQEQEQSIIDIIKANNRLNILLSKKKENSSHGTADESVIIVDKDTDQFGALVLPEYLFKTGADIEQLQYHLGLIAKYFPNYSIRKQLKDIIATLTPQYAGVFIVLLLLCYDIETYKNREKIQNLVKKIQKG